MIVTSAETVSAGAMVISVGIVIGATPSDDAASADDVPTADVSVDAALTAAEPSELELRIPLFAKIRRARADMLKAGFPPRFSFSAAAAEDAIGMGATGTIGRGRTATEARPRIRPGRGARAGRTTASVTMAEGVDTTTDGLVKVTGSDATVFD